MTELTTDIVVIGSGMAGYAAAMAAAETHSVIVVDKTGTPGGAATHTNVGTLCGLYFRGNEAVAVNHPFCKKFITNLQNYDQHAKIISLPDGLHVIAYEWSNLQKLLTNNLTQSKNITLLFGHEIAHIATQNAAINTLIIEGNSSRKQIKFKAVIDCTGNGFVAQMLKHPMLTEPSYQAAAQVIRLKNIGETTEYALNLAIRKTIIKNKGTHAWPANYTMTSVIPGSLRHSQVDLKIPLSGNVTDAATQANDLQEEIKIHLPSLLKSLREIQSLENAKVETVFPAPGIRIQQRPQGKYILTEEDVPNGKSFDDCIAIGTWPIEEWDYSGKVMMEYFRTGNAYDIPARCLQSPVYANLFFAGKGISAETKAIASARVTGTCLQTGYAAGRLAVCESIREQQHVIQQIQRALKA